MDHTCHQCGREIEEGTPFCRNCGAPQIRIPGIEAPTPPPVTSGTPGEVQPPQQPAVIGTNPQPEAPSRVDWSQALPAAATTALLLTIGWFSPFFGYCLLLLAAGVIGVVFYRRRAPKVVITPAIGARIGAICGLFGFIGFCVITAVGMLLLRGSTELREKLQQAIQQSAARNPDPNVQQMMAQMTTPAGLALIVTFVMVIFLIGFIALSSAGGAIGAKLFRNKSE